MARTTQRTRRTAAPALPLFTVTIRDKGEIRHWRRNAPSASAARAIVAAELVRARDVAVLGAHRVTQERGKIVPMPSPDASPRDRAYAMRSRSRFLARIAGGAAGVSYWRGMGAADGRVWPMAWRRGDAGHRAETIARAFRCLSLAHTRSFTTDAGWRRLAREGFAHTRAHLAAVGSFLPEAR
jgi:hypothetical protein